MDMLFDPLFYSPWCTGLFLSITLPLLGIYLRLRNEWLAALGLAQMSAAAGLIGYGLGIPLFVMGPVGGITMAFIKHFSASDNTGYALMILAGWAITFLLAANTSLGESISQALIDGQIYFVQSTQAVATATLMFFSLLLLRQLAPHLLRAELFPHYEKLNKENTYRWHLGFDLLVAIAMGIATASVGLMTAFAMVFIPAWVAFKISASWKKAHWIALSFNLAAFIIGFTLAILADQPYGPTQVACHLILAILVLLAAKLLAKN